MKKIILITSLLLVGTSLNVLGDGHLAEEQSKGAFTTIMVSAKDTDKYLKSVASNPALFELIGADAGGYCRTVSGQDYPGQVMVWTAFPNVAAALVGGSKYEPSNAPRAMAKLREFKYSSTWAPLKVIARLDPGYERVTRIKVSPANVPALAALLTKVEKEIQEAGHGTYINGLYTAIGGGTQEAGTLTLRNITEDEKTMGAVIDDYFTGASWADTWLQATSLIDEVVSDQFEVCEQFYTAE
tara:strand:+ start:217 stop:942 length:726 start_codon:yes stop_codon:yes gene_type:complete